MSQGRSITREKLPGELKTLIANVIDRDESDIPADANLIEALEIDSVMRLEILVALERTYQVKMGQEDIQRIVSLNDICDLLVEKAQHQGT